MKTIINRIKALRTNAKQTATALVLTIMLSFVAPASLAADKQRGEVLNQYLKWRDKMETVGNGQKQAIETLKTANGIIEDSRKITDPDKDIEQSARLMARDQAVNMFIDAKEQLDISVVEMKKKLEQHRPYAMAAKRALESADREKQLSIRENVNRVNALGAEFAAIRDKTGASMQEEMRGRAGAYIARMNKELEKILKEKFNANSAEEFILMDGARLATQIDIASAYSSIIDGFLTTQRTVQEVARFRISMSEFEELGQQLLSMLDSF